MTGNSALLIASSHGKQAADFRRRRKVIWQPAGIKRPRQRSYKPTTGTDESVAHPGGRMLERQMPGEAK